MNATEGWQTMWKGAFQQKCRVVLPSACLQMWPELGSIDFPGYF